MIRDEKELKKEYNRIWSGGDLKEEREYYEWIAKILDLRKGERLLDVACGGGFLLKEGEKRGLHTYGIEISEIALRKAMNISNKAKVVCGSAEYLPYKDKAFDVVTCLGSIEHFINPEKALIEMRRVLKDDGKACIVLPNTWFLADVFRGWIEGEGLSHLQELERFYSLKEAMTLITREGEFGISYIGKYNPPYQIIKREKPLKSFNFPYLTFYRLLRKVIPVKCSYVFVFLCTKVPQMAQREIVPGREKDNCFFLGGWYNEENWPPVIRWSDKSASIYIFIDNIASSLFIKTKASHLDISERPVKVSVSINNDELMGSFEIKDSEWKVYKVGLVEGIRGKVCKVTFNISRSWNPHIEIGTGDDRELGIAVEKIWVA